MAKNLNARSTLQSCLDVHPFFALARDMDKINNFGRRCELWDQIAQKRAGPCHVIAVYEKPQLSQLRAKL